MTWSAVSTQNTARGARAAITPAARAMAAAVSRPQGSPSTLPGGTSGTMARTAGTRSAPVTTNTRSGATSGRTRRTASASNARRPTNASNCLGRRLVLIGQKRSPRPPARMTA